MKKTGKCPKCGSVDIVCDAIATDRENSEGEMSIITYRKPEAFIFKQAQEMPVPAWVCVDCGFVEYYADHPQLLKSSTPAPKK